MADKSTPRNQESLPSKLRHHPLMTLREEMDDMFTRFFGGTNDSWFARCVPMTADLSETDTEIEVNIDLPGINPDDLDIQLTGNTLHVRGERKEQSEEKGRTFHRVETRRGSFSRSLPLPCSVVEDGVAASYKDGVLTIKLPKSDEAKVRKIPIRHE